MRAMFSISDLDFNGIKLGNATIEVDYTIEELTVLAETYKALAPALIAAFAGIDPDTATDTAAPELSDREFNESAADYVRRFYLSRE